MIEKQQLAKEYAILKKAVWRDEGVPGKTNSETAHYRRAMRFMTVSDLEIQTARLFGKLIKGTV